MVAKVVTSAIENLDMKYPEVPAAKHALIAAAKNELEAEED